MCCFQNTGKWFGTSTSPYLVRDFTFLHYDEKNILDSKVADVIMDTIIKLNFDPIYLLIVIMRLSM